MWEVLEHRWCRLLDCLHLKSVKEERSRYKQRVAELERRLSELNKGVMSRDNLIQSLEDSHHKLNARLEEKEVSLPQPVEC